MAKQKQDKKAAINQFAIYDIGFETEPQLETIHNKAEIETYFNQTKKCLHSILDGKLTIYRKGKNGDPTIYPNDMLAVHKDVYLLRLNNRKNTILVKQAETTTNGVPDYKEKTEESNPYCYIIIDNRPGVTMMAIQKNSAWGDPLNVCGLLEQNLDRKMLDTFGFHVRIYPRMREYEIWEFAHEQCHVNGDRLNGISFLFPNPKQVKFTDRIPAEFNKGYVGMLCRMMKRTNAISTLIQTTYDNVEPDVIKKISGDLAQIISYCRNSKYDLCLSFRDYGKYHCLDLVKALFPMQEELLNSFIHNFPETSETPDADNISDAHDYGLIRWLDEIEKKALLYKDATKTPGKRRRKHR